MIGHLVAGWNRVYGFLGRLTMYRLMLFALGALFVIALAISFTDQLAATPLALVVSGLVLAVTCVLTDAVAHRFIGRRLRFEVSLITALILLFVMRPTLEPLPLAGIALAGIVASASKYLLAWRGRHVFNPAAFGAAFVTVVSLWAPDLGASSWWVGTPLLAIPVVVLGLAVLVRVEKIRVVLVFLIVAVAVGYVRTVMQYQEFDLAFEPADVLWLLVSTSPYLFLGVFMLSEPLTLPSRRWQQFTVAVVVGVLVGWPISVGDITLGQERALLIGNLLAFALAIGSRSGIALSLAERSAITPSVSEYTFTAARPFTFAAGQYLELEVPHAHADSRGMRREFSIVSAPEDLPTVRIAMRTGGVSAASSYKQAIGAIEPGTRLPATGVWGDFVLPKRGTTPILMVAAGVGITPFISQLRHLHRTDDDRDVILIYVASAAEDLAFRPELEELGVRVVVFTRDKPADLPRQWTWARGVRLDAEGLVSVVPDIGSRHAYVSGPPALIADLSPALERARSLTTDAFAGY